MPFLDKQDLTSWFCSEHPHTFLIKYNHSKIEAFCPNCVKHGLVFKQREVAPKADYGGQNGELT